jgi:trans-AT polyketide synthase/acyltransferase/oxidoreductase domain-containing protein
VKACVFPGQGSQAAGMGEGLFERYPEITAAADEILGYSVAELCLREADERLHLTQYTQPALYVVNALAYRSRCDGGAPPPDFVAGHSLGEYNALLAAEVFSFEAGLRLVKRRGELMSAATGGGMAAILGCAWEQVEEILRTNGLTSIDVANYNSPTQVVLSGPAEDIARADALFSETGATYRILKVSAAFHSRYMEGFASPLAEALEGVELHPPKIPVIANVSARPYEVHQVREYLQRQMREPVRWLESVQYLLGVGVDEFEEVGPGTVLAKLIKSIRKGSTPLPAPRARENTAARPASAEGAAPIVTAGRLGAESFRRDYDVRGAYVAGSMHQGIASKDLVVRMGKAGYIGLLGADGLDAPRLEEEIRSIKRSLGGGEPFGVNLLSKPEEPESERTVVELCLRHGVRFLEATGYVTASPELIRYRLKGLTQDGDGRLVSRHKVIAKVSRPDVAETFLNPPSEPIVADLLRAGLVSAEEARLARRMPLADDLCVEADSGGALGDIAILLPAVIRQRDEVCRRHGYETGVRVGCAGGIGTPEAAASAFLLGADFILTGSVNQCTVEAGTSETVKDLLQTINVQDTEYAPAGDLFEGARVRVLKKGVFFPARANKLHDLWRNHGSWDEIDVAVRAKIERDYFGRSFESILDASSHSSTDKKQQMEVVFRWYFDHAMRLALSGAKDQRVNYQVRCSPALGAFNQWVRGTSLEPWRQRHVDAIADAILEGAAEVLSRQLQRFSAKA